MDVVAQIGCDLFVLQFQKLLKLPNFGKSRIKYSQVDKGGGGGGGHPPLVAEISTPPLELKYPPPPLGWTQHPPPFFVPGQIFLNDYV